VRRRRDLAVVANLRWDRGTRPAELIRAISRQAGRRISWKVLEETLRRLEAEGYVARQEMPGPRETWYWLLPAAGETLDVPGRLDAWYREREAADGQGSAVAARCARSVPSSLRTPAIESSTLSDTPAASPRSSRM
jgi:DNA-binding HxlR family transcriptional regulator